MYSNFIIPISDIIFRAGNPELELSSYDEDSYSNSEFTLEELLLSEEKGSLANKKRNQKNKKGKKYLSKNINSKINSFDNMNKLDNFEGNIIIDAPEKILGCKYDSNREIVFQVEWVKRTDDSKPWVSLVPFKSMKERYPTIILEFLEGNLYNGNKSQKFDEDGFLI